MTISLNGKPAMIERQDVSITQLLAGQNVKSPDMVSVQLNGDFLRREEFESTLLKDSDEVEFLYFMGGGSGASFTEDQIMRYSRHILLSNVGGTGQEKLLAARVLIVGAGGLGSPTALYLAAAGVGTLGLVDSDDLDLTNLQRQVLFDTDDVGRHKVEAAARRLRRLNPDVRIEPSHERVSAENVMRLIRGYDFIVEGTDNFPTKFLLNDACVLAGKPFSQGGILRFEGQTMTYVPGSACYRCVYEAPPPKGAVPTCSEAGVLGAVPGILGSIQAAETLKHLLGIGELLTNRVLSFDALAMEFRTVRVKRNPRCAVCGESPSITEPLDYERQACDIQAREIAV